jgi:hypothetical protein
VIYLLCGYDPYRMLEDFARVYSERYGDKLIKDYMVRFGRAADGLFEVKEYEEYTRKLIKEVDDDLKSRFSEVNLFIKRKKLFGIGE